MRVPRKIIWRLRQPADTAERLRPYDERGPPQNLSPGISVSDREFLVAHRITPPSEPQSGGEEPLGAVW
jgi:hypothetical protein